MVTRTAAILCCLFIPAWAWGLWTGNDHHDRTDLNTERLLDAEHFLDLLAYRAFWPSPPSYLGPGRRESQNHPRAYARTSEGSMGSDRFYIHREIGVRGTIGTDSFWGYHLWQLDDFEQDFFYQQFEGQARVLGPLALRVIGQPTGKKQDSDLGGGAALFFGPASLRMDVTRVDFFFNEKNLDNQSDRHPLYNVLTVIEAPIPGGLVESGFEWDSPVSREFHDEDRLFAHRRTTAWLRGSGRTWDARGRWREEHRSLEELSTGNRVQDYRLLVAEGELARLFQWGARRGRVGAHVQRRRAHFQSSTGIVQQRWEIDPYAALQIPLSARWTFEGAVYLGLVWLKDADPAERRDFSVQSKAQTALRVDFTPDVGLVMNPTWDLDELGSGRSFDGGNVQFQARIP